MTNAKLTEEQVWLILHRLYKIEIGEPGDTQKRIAKDFNVNIKTINRIEAGKTWLPVKTRFDSDPLHQVNRALHSSPVPSTDIWPEDVHGQSATIEGHKRRYPFDPKLPLHWGAFDWVNGEVIRVVTDGKILFCSPILHTLAQQIEATGRPEEPFHAKKANELPYFEVAEMLTQPINSRFIDKHVSADITELVSEQGSVFVSGHYLSHFDSFDCCLHNCAYYMAGTREDYIYVVDLEKIHESADMEKEFPILAVIATLEKK